MKPWADVGIRTTQRNGSGGENETQGHSTTYERGDQSTGELPEISVRHDTDRGLPGCASIWGSHDRDATTRDTRGDPRKCTAD